MILVEIYVPAMDENYDFMLDEDTKVEQIIGELEEMLSKKAKSVCTDPIEAFILCSRDRKEVLPMQKTLAACHIRDGSQLLLV